MVKPIAEHAQVVPSAILAGNPCPRAVVGGDVGPQCHNVDAKLGETIPVGNKKRFPLRISLNSNESVT